MAEDSGEADDGASSGGASLGGGDSAPGGDSASGGESSSVDSGQSLLDFIIFPRNHEGGADDVAADMAGDDADDDSGDDADDDSGGNAHEDNNDDDVIVLFPDDDDDDEQNIAIEIESDDDNGDGGGDDINAAADDGGGGDAQVMVQCEQMAHSNSRSRRRRQQGQGQGRRQSRQRRRIGDEGDDDDSDYLPPGEHPRDPHLNENLEVVGGLEDGRRSSLRGRQQASDELSEAVRGRNQFNVSLGVGDIVRFETQVVGNLPPVQATALIYAIEYHFDNEGRLEEPPDISTRPFIGVHPHFMEMVDPSSDRNDAIPAGTVFNLNQVNILPGTSLIADPAGEIVRRIGPVNANPNRNHWQNNIIAHAAVFHAFNDAWIQIANEGREDEDEDED